MSAYDLFLLLLQGEDTPEPALGRAYLSQAEALILGYLGESSLPTSPVMDSILSSLAITLYNRRGAEGERQRSEGEVMSQFESVEEMLRISLKPFQKARAIGMSQRAGER